MRLIATLLVVALPLVAYAGAFEIAEQSPAGAGMAGAQTAAVDDAAAVFYNPAALTFQRGFSAVLGGGLQHTSIRVRAPQPFGMAGTLGTPTVHLAQRMGPYLAIGVGVFSQFAQRLGNFELETTTINPSVSLRPIPHVSVGFGLAIVPAWSSLDALGYSLRGGATGLGGNVGVLARIVPRYLYLGIHYRSAIDLDLTGGPTSPPGDGSYTLPLPHQVAFGVSSNPIPMLTLAFDARLTFWRELERLSFSHTPPGATVPDTQTIVLGLRESTAFRLGAELRLLEDQLRLRLGLGFDTPPTRLSAPQTLIPDAYRVVASAGLGYHFGPVGLEAGYSAQVILERTFDTGLTYDGIVHVASIALVVHFKRFGPLMNLPAYRRY